uniref:SPT2 chromatin protein n=1 Tax=Leersia perrieri TaxID=77586 RepID=A0A0D9XRG3_9ORYZ
MGGYEYATNGYHRRMEDAYEDEYYSEDGYEEEGSGAGEEYEEDDEPPEGQQEFLQIRERLKEQIRRKAQAASASAAGRSSSSHDRKPTSNFGSFFGPSKPVISQRVIEERKSLKELQNTASVSRDRRPSGKEIPSSSSKVQSKTNGFHQKQKIVNEAKRKAEALKDNRDYSFLLSDDADISSSPMEKSVARSSLTQKSDRELTHSAVKSRAPTGQTARLSNGHGLKNTSSTQRHAESSRVDSNRKVAGANRERVVLDNGRMHSVVRNGSSQATTSKATSQKLPSKGPIANRPPVKSVNDHSLRTNHPASKQLLTQNGRSESSRSQRMQSTSHGQRPHQPVQSQRPQQSLQSRRPQQSPQNTRAQVMSQSQRPQQSLQRQRPQLSSQNGRLQSSERQRPLSQSYRPQSSQGQRPLSSQGHYPEQRRVQANDRIKSVEKQTRPPSKPMPSRQIPSNGMRDVHAKKKQPAKRRFNDFSDDEEDPLAMIRSMFRYDPSKYAGRDEDVSDMEADFATIEMEEKRSARIARQEDDEQLRLIEEEERREQERKRRKMGRGR